MTLWAFGGLLVLPVFSRNVVFAADRAAADAGITNRPPDHITMSHGVDVAVFPSDDRQRW